MFCICQLIDFKPSAALDNQMTVIPRIAVHQFFKAFSDIFFRKERRILLIDCDGFIGYSRNNIRVAVEVNNIAGLVNEPHIIKAIDGVLIRYNTVVFLKLPFVEITVCVNELSDSLFYLIKGDKRRLIVAAYITYPNTLLVAVP